jgi:putative FmdB family regulatory protein
MAAFVGGDFIPTWEHQLFWSGWNPNLPFKHKLERGKQIVPDYDFKCAQCRKRFTVTETFEQHDHHKRVKCPKCGSQKVERVIGSVFAKTSKKS